MSSPRWHSGGVVDCANCDGSGCDQYLPLDSAVLLAAKNLAAARTAYAEAWLRHRVRAKSDQQATHMATVETNDAVTLAEAKLEVARGNLHRR